MKILFAGYRDERHSYYGGYDWITKFPGSDYLNSNSFFLGNLSVGNKLRIFNFVLLDFLTRLNIRKYDIIHYFYGDLTMFIPFKKKHKHIIIATIHLNHSVPYRVNIYKVLNTCDAIIVLSSFQARYFREHFGLNTFFVPHGFNKPLWKYKIPNSIDGKKIDKKKVNIICIGKQYRDINLLIQTVTKVNTEEIVFHIVGNKVIHEKLRCYKYVLLYDFLSDDEYYSLLSECDYNFMPLIFSTANNALLEAQALGIISILPRITGIEDYASSDNIFYSTVQELEEIMSKLDKRSKSSYLIAFSKKFEWQNIYNELKKIYNKLLQEKQ